MAFYTGTSDGALQTMALSIKPDGKIGVGTLSPLAKLDVRGDIILGTNISLGTGNMQYIGLPNSSGSFADNSGAIGIYFKQEDINGSGSIGFRSHLNGVQNEVAMVVSKEGNIGIGTTTPIDKLHVAGGIRSSGYAADYGNGDQVTLDYNNGNARINVRNSGSTGVLTFLTNSTERMRIDSTGNVGIGTISPMSPLHVKGHVILEGSNVTKKWSVFSGAIGDPAPETFTIREDGYGDRLVITPLNGYVGIGNIAPAYNLDVTGDLRITGTPYRTGGDIAWQVPSDARLKDVHDAYDRGLNAILGIDTVKYNYKQGNAVGADPSQEYVGVIAQQVQQVIPEAVKQDKNGYLSLNSSPIFLDNQKRHKSALREDCRS